MTSPCHFVRVFARVIDRHATLIGGWKTSGTIARDENEKEEDGGEKVETAATGGRRRGWEDTVANLKGRPAEYVVR